MATHIVRETWLLFKRSITQAVRNPVWLFMGFFEPILYLALFMPLLKSLGGAPGLPVGKTVNVFVPGILVMLSIVGSLFVGFGLVAEIREGLIDRLLVAPISRISIILGRVLKDVLVIISQATLLTVAAIPCGLELSIPGFLLGLVLFGLIGASMSSMSYAFALMLKSEDALAPTLQTFMQPVQFLSGFMLPLALAPVWLQTVALFNPFSHAVNAARALFAGNILCMDVAFGFGAVCALTLLTLWWANRILVKMSA